MDKHCLCRSRSKSVSTSQPALPHPLICTCNVYERSKRAGLLRNQIKKIIPNTTRRFAVPSCGNNSLCIAFLLITLLGKHISTLSSFVMKFYGFIYKQGTISCGIFRKTETKRRYRADYIGSDSNVASHKCE